MSIRKFAGAAFISTIALVSPVLSADLPLRGAPGAPSPLAAEPASTWEGFYAGVHAGYGKTVDDVVGIRQSGPGGVVVRTLHGNLKPGGVLGGLQMGYNWQSGNVVFGVEADITRLSGSASFTGLYPAPVNDTVTTSAKKDWTGSARMRLGYSFSNILLFSTIGISGTTVQYRLAPAGGIPVTHNNLRPSLVVGGGAEYAINESWSARIEGLYSPIGLRRIPSTAGLNGPIGTFETQGHWLARIGVNYRFGAKAAAPVIARF